MANIEALNKLLNTPMQEGNSYIASNFDNVKINEAYFDDYHREEEEVSFIPLESDLIIYDWKDFEPIDDFSSLEKDVIVKIYSYFKSLREKQLCFSCGLFIGKNKVTHKIKVFGVNICCQTPEFGQETILEALKEASLKEEPDQLKKEGFIFPFLKVANYLILASLIVGCGFLYLQNKKLKENPFAVISPKPITQSNHKLLDKDIASPDLDKIWSFYQKSFPDLFNKLKATTPKDKPIKELSEKLLVPDYVSSLWGHYHKDFWLNKSISDKEKSSMISRNILYDFFNKNKKVIKLVKDNKKLLKNTKFLRLYKVYTNNKFKQDIYYWSDSNFRIENNVFSSLLKEYNIESGWNWVSEANSDNVNLQFKTYGNIPVSVESLEKRDKRLLAIIDGEEAVFFRPNESTMLRNSTYKKIKTNIENPDGSNKIRWYILPDSFPNSEVRYIRKKSAELAGVRLDVLDKYIKGKGLSTTSNEILRLIKAKNPLINQLGGTKSCTKEGNGCGFRATDPVVAMLLFNFIDKYTIPRDKSQLEREQSVINESHILMAKRNDSGYASFEFITSDKERHQFFIKRDSFELVKKNGEKITLNKISPSTFLNNYVYEANEDGVSFSICIDDAKISNSPYLMKTVKENNRCEVIESGEDN